MNSTGEFDDVDLSDSCPSDGSDIEDLLQEDDS
jgi:hypothetical protein